MTKYRLEPLRITETSPLNAFARQRSAEFFDGEVVKEGRRQMYEDGLAAEPWAMISEPELL